MDYSLYPPNWLSEIRPRILDRAHHQCEFCGVPDHALGYRDSRGVFVRINSLEELKEGKVFKIFLTIAHLDHDPQNWDVEDHRLAALCARCHLSYDRANLTHVMAKRKAHGTLPLFV